MGTEQLASTISIKETKFVMKSLCTKKIPGPDNFTGEFSVTYKEETTLVLHTILQKVISGKGNFMPGFHSDRPLL